MMPIKDVKMAALMPDLALHHASDDGFSRAAPAEGKAPAEGEAPAESEAPVRERSCAPRLSSLVRSLTVAVLSKLHPSNGA